MVSLFFLFTLGMAQFTPVSVFNREPPKDSGFSNVVLLIQPSATSSSITDISSNGHTIVSNGDVSLSSAIADPWGGDRKIIHFDGTGDYLQVADNDDWFFEGDFTIELWAYFTTLAGGTDSAFVSQSINPTNRHEFAIYNGANDGLEMDYRNATSPYTIEVKNGSDTLTPLNSWTHFAISRQGSVFRLFMDGVLISSATSVDTLVNLASPLYIGSRDGSLSMFAGYMTGLRITKDYSRYISSFTAPTTPHPQYEDTDLCDGTPAIGSFCSGGALYAGTYDSGKYMVTPAGCTDSATPTCNGTPDTLKKRWYGVGGSSVDIATLTNLTVQTNPAPQRGDITTPLIIADASVAANSAAEYCSLLNFGGYTDWFLPSKSELAYVLCRSNATFTTSYPNEDPNCTVVGGKSSELGGFALSRYWTSTENRSSHANLIDFSDGRQIDDPKSGSKFVRCVRRY